MEWVGEWNRNRNEKLVDVNKMSQSFQCITAPTVKQFQECMHLKITFAAQCNLSNSENNATHLSQRNRTFTLHTSLEVLV